MTQVFFYHNAENRLAEACTLLAKAYAAKKPMLVLAPGETGMMVDRLLWTRTAQGFVPHCAVDAPLAGETPILLTSSLNLPPPYPIERLMNLGLEIPAGYTDYPSLIEVVGRDETDRAAARARVHQYKTAGCEIRYFDLGKTQD